MKPSRSSGFPGPPSKQARRHGVSPNDDIKGSGSSRDAVRDIAGYVYDPERRRYFRAKEGVPDNNFTLPLHRILSRTRKAERVWLHPQLQQRSSLADILLLSQSGPATANPAAVRRSYAAYQHGYLDFFSSPIFNLKANKVADSIIPVEPSDSSTIPAFNVDLDGSVSSSFDAVAVSFEGAQPQVVFASGKILDPNVAVELRLALLKWSKDTLIPVRSRKLILPYKDLKLPTTGERIEVGSVHILRAGMTFMSCARYDASTNDPKGSFILHSAGNGMQSTCLGHFQNVCATNFENETVATACGSLPSVLYFQLGDASRIRQLDLPNPDSVITSLEFHPNNKGILFGGTARGEVFRRDWRGRGPEMLIDERSPWQTMGLNANCRVTTIKALKNPNWFITGVAAVPENADKISLWDCRNLRTPFTNFEGSQVAFHREKMQISLSSDQSLAVVSDSTGLTRFWDVNSGTLLASLPVPSLACFATDTHTDTQEAAPISFYFAKDNKRLLLLAKRGKDPRVLIQNFKK